jgi:urocanate hydratase
MGGAQPLAATMAARVMPGDRRRPPPDPEAPRDAYLDEVADDLDDALAGRR